MQSPIGHSSQRSTVNKSFVAAEKLLAIMAEKTRILIIGGTGSLGKCITEASIKAGHATFVLVRQSTLSNPAKSDLIETFKSQGIKLVQGDMYDHNDLVTAIKQVDVVISCVTGEQIADQVKIIAAIKEDGNVKRFIPSEFSTNVDQVEGAVEPAASFYRTKARIRRRIEAGGVPYTYISCYGFAKYFLDGFRQENATSPPRDKVVILGDGNTKGVCNVEADIATYTIRTVDDPRTLNKILHIRPTANIFSFNELVSIWEKKIGKTLDRVYIPEEQVLQSIQESTYPKNLLLSLGHATFIKGVMANVVMDPSSDAEATELYPEVQYTTVDEYLDKFV